LAYLPNSAITTAIPKPGILPRSTDLSVLGAQLKGSAWKRDDDELAIAFVGNGISAPHRNYLAAGGYGFIIGDGKLNYGTELIGEIYYKLNAYQNKLFISPDYQFIINPAYNKDRGPVNVLSIRAHVEF
jgi:high affinity Mn2+ porin